MPSNAYYESIDVSSLSPEDYDEFEALLNSYIQADYAWDPQYSRFISRDPSGIVTLQPDVLEPLFQQVNELYGQEVASSLMNQFGYEYSDLFASESTETPQEEVVDVAADTTADEEPTIGDFVSSVGDTLGDIVGNISIDLPTITPSPEDTIADILGPGVGVISPSGGVSPGTFDPGDWSVYVPGIPGLPSTSPNTIIGTVDEIAGQIEDAISDPGSVLSDIGDTIGDIVSDPAGAIESAVDAIGGSVSVDDAGNVILGGAIVDAVTGNGSSGGTPVVAPEPSVEDVGGLAIGGYDDQQPDVVLGGQVDSGEFTNQEEVIGGLLTGGTAAATGGGLGYSTPRQTPSFEDYMYRITWAPDAPLQVPTLSTPSTVPGLFSKYFA